MDQNLADLASRGLSAEDFLQNFPNWVMGLDFLTEGSWLEEPLSIAHLLG